MSKTQTCEYCHGTGREIGSDSIECPICHGNGFTGDREIPEEEVEGSEEETASKKAKKDDK